MKPQNTLVKSEFGMKKLYRPTKIADLMMHVDTHTHLYVEEFDSDREVMLERSGLRVVVMTGLVLSLLLGIAGYIHQQIVGWDHDRTLFWISILIGVGHMIYFMLKLGKKK